MLMGYLVFSNHCAFSQLIEQGRLKEQVEKQCCDRQKQDQAPSRDPHRTCCKALRILLPDTVALTDAPAQFITNLPSFWEFEVTVISLNTNVDVRVDTGPLPGATSFIELVLHRSLRSHAPPVIG